jgi:hypothetical protein
MKVAQLLASSLLWTITIMPVVRADYVCVPSRYGEATHLAIRTAPGSNSIVSLAARGAVVRVLGHEEGWVYVRVIGGASGWAAQRWICGGFPDTGR